MTRVRPWLLCVPLAVVACEPKTGGDQNPSSEPRSSSQVDRVAERGEATRADPQNDVRDQGEAVADPTRAPDGYGEFRIPGGVPAEDTVTLHGLAGYEVVVVYAEPTRAAQKLGYLRLGQRSRAAEVRGEAEDCPKGWYQLAEGGFVCASRGFVVDRRPPFMKFPPPPPKLDSPNPYPWMFVRRWNSPMWWRLPSDGEWVTARRARALREARRLDKVFIDPHPPGSKVLRQRPNSGADILPTSTSDAAVRPARVTATDTPEGDRRPAESSTDELPRRHVVPEVDPSAGEGLAGVIADLEARIEQLPLSPAQPWLERGFFISVGEEFEHEGESWVRTARGAYVQADDLAPYEAKDFVGRELSEDMGFPMLGFVRVENAQLWHYSESPSLGLRSSALIDDTLRAAPGSSMPFREESVELDAFAVLPRQSFLQFDGDTEISGVSYLVTQDGLLIEAGDVVMPVPQTRPEGVQAWERWIDVDLDRQLLVAYEGDEARFVTLVSTGRRGTAAEPFATPVGQWRIYNKQTTSNMDGSTQSGDSYALQDVPWVMFFDGNYALHGAFWHRKFGRVRSHGCVNLGPSDARWLFQWATPFVPDGWHGANASADNPGSLVVVRKADSPQSG